MEYEVTDYVPQHFGQDFHCRECFDYFNKQQTEQLQKRKKFRRPNACQDCHHFQMCHRTDYDNEHLCPLYNNEPYYCEDWKICPTGYKDKHLSNFKATMRGIRDSNLFNDDDLGSAMKKAGLNDEQRKDAFGTYMNIVKDRASQNQVFGKQTAQQWKNRYLSPKPTATLTPKVKSLPPKKETNIPFDHLDVFDMDHCQLVDYQKYLIRQKSMIQIKLTTVEQLLSVFNESLEDEPPKKKRKIDNLIDLSEKENDSKTDDILEYSDQNNEMQ